MKKKALTVILPLCVAMTMTACGGNVDTTEVEETTAITESTEADAQAEAEAKAQEEAEEQAQFEEAAECYEAGQKSLYGLEGAEIDIEDAYTNFTKAQELGNIDANFYLGVLTDWYAYPEEDYEQARVYYEQCEDNPYAQIALGCLYCYGRGVEQDSEKGKEFFQSAADQGVAEGYYGLAMVEEDAETAFEYYNKVAEEGTEQFYITRAINSLGWMYQYGDGVEQDVAKAIEWYTKAADLGDVNAMNNLGFIYEYSDGVEQDVAKAVEWYTKAAEAGDTSAIMTLASMYEFGNGVEQDIDKANEWYAKAVEWYT